MNTTSLQMPKINRLTIAEKKRITIKIIVLWMRKKTYYDKNKDRIMDVEKRLVRYLSGTQAGGVSWKWDVKKSKRLFYGCGKTTGDTTDREQEIVMIKDIWTRPHDSAY